MAAPTYELGERRWLQEKVVTTYERLWRGDDLSENDSKELFNLKVNAGWLQTHIASASVADLRARKATLCRLFAECCSRLDDEHSADVQCHAMETLSGIFLGVGCRTFLDPVRDVLELLCGIEEADSVFGSLVAHLKRLLASKRRGLQAAALRRTAIRLLLSLTAGASDLQRNILVELLMPHGIEAPIAELLQSDDGSDAGGSSAGGVASPIEDTVLLVVLLATYRRHESPNAFLRMLSDAPADAAHLQALARVSRRMLERCMYPKSGEATLASSVLGPSWSYSLARAAEWAAHSLTVEAYLPAAISAQLSSPQALRANAAQLTVALLVAYELAAPHGGGTLAALCAQPEASAAASVLGACATRGALLRHVFSVGSLLACDARDELLVAQLRLVMLIIERTLDGSASAPLLLSADLGGHLPMWRYSSVHIRETALPSPQPLLAGGYELLAGLLTQNLRRATFHAPMYLQALTLLHRLLVAQHRASQKLPLLRWSAVWESLFTTADFIAADEVFSMRGVAEVALRVLEVINVLICLGDSLLPTVALFESFAYELVRRRSVFEKLYRVARKAAPRLVEAMALARSMIVNALDTIAKMEPAAAASLTAAQALDVIRSLNPAVKPEMTIALLRPPAQLSPHEQIALSHSLLRVLLAHCRRDGSLAPLHYEDLCK